MSGYTERELFVLPPGVEEPTYYFNLRRQARTRRLQTTELSVKAIADVNNLATVFELMRNKNGPSPGPDGLRYGDVGRRELFDLLRPVSKAILNGSYKPGPARIVTIPKAGGRGMRALKLRNLIDRVVARALAEALTHFWEKIFLDGSHGFRPGRSTLTLLAHLERAVTEQGRWVLAIDDVRDAFGSVNVDALMAFHRQHLSIGILNQLVERVLQGYAGNVVGIDQGCPFSPLGLNIFLHHAYDVYAHALGANPGTPTPWYRYADNLVVPCQDVQEGRQVLDQTASALNTAGLALKGEFGGQPADLRKGKSAHLLGFTLFRQRDQLCFKLGPDVWARLEQNLLKAHETEHPGRAAQAVLLGWLQSNGPAFRSRQDRTVRRALRLASSLGFRELYGPEFYEKECRHAWRRWKSLSSQPSRGEPLPSPPSMRRSGGSAGHQRPGAKRKRPRPAAGIVSGGRLFFPTATGTKGSDGSRPRRKEVLDVTPTPTDALPATNKLTDDHEFSNEDSQR
jgi:hypothetical protein